MLKAWNPVLINYKNSHRYIILYLIVLFNIHLQKHFQIPLFKTLKNMTAQCSYSVISSYQFVCYLHESKALSVRLNIALQNGWRRWNWRVFYSFWLDQDNWIFLYFHSSDGSSHWRSNQAGMKKHAFHLKQYSHQLFNALHWIHQWLNELHLF